MEAASFHFFLHLDPREQHQHPAGCYKTDWEAWFDCDLRNGEVHLLVNKTHSKQITIKILPPHKQATGNGCDCYGGLEATTDSPIELRKAIVRSP